MYSIMIKTLFVPLSPHQESCVIANPIEIQGPAVSALLRICRYKSSWTVWSSGYAQGKLKPPKLEWNHILSYPHTPTKRVIENENTSSTWMQMSVWDFFKFTFPLNLNFPFLSRYLVVVGWAVLRSWGVIGPKSQEPMTRLLDHNQVRFHDRWPYFRIQNAAFHTCMNSGYRHGILRKCLLYAKPMFNIVNTKKK